MIDQSHKWIFFTATALMCAVSFAGAQLAQAEARIGPAREFNPDYAAMT